MRPKTNTPKRFMN